MKKIILFAFLFSFTKLSNAQHDNSLINTFLNSTEFQKIQNQVYAFGQIDNLLSRVTYVDDNINKPILNIAITQNNVVKAVVEAVPVPSTLNNVLPNNEHYVMQLIDYSSYDINTKTGVIKTIDLNYDSYQSSQITISNSSINDFTAYPIPAKIKAKYSGLKTIGEIESGRTGESQGRIHPCDRNQNGNLGFGECMGCMQQACNGSSNCATLCWLTNVAGIGTSIGGQCTISMGAACLILSWMY